MGAAAREFVVGSCSVDAVVERYRQTYAEALQAWRRRRHKSGPALARGRVARWIARRLGWEARRPVAPATPDIAPDEALLGGVR